jgi:Tol biopolymer transport system component/tRNA A-37 threonylcarbamoyl transferase component Bud32
MGEVYRARDTRLSRDVAVKALPDEFARDPDRLARFEREAKLLASLTHSNIAGIFGLEEVEGHRYLILELVEGETLAQRLDRGPLSIDEALHIGRQIAAALESAHENGIAHRDLKPGNVMITPAGDAKVLDFGLAKGGMGTASGSDVNLTHSPTLTHQHTSAGVILGTAAYMSPEQARGRAVDKRTDIWSFGCVLYECLAGRQAFAGDTVSDMIARILERDPDWDALPARTPSRIRELLRRCLEKDAKRRLRDIGDARIEIDDVIATKSSSPSAVQTAPHAARAATRRWLVTAGVVFAALVAQRFLTPLFEKASSAPPVRFEIAETPGTEMVIDGALAAISPDGRSLAYAAADSAGVVRLWVRPLESLTARELAGTENVQLPFWSPDNKYIAFFSGEEKLMKVAVNGGKPETICAIKGPRGGTWNRDGVILFAPLSEGPIHRVSANGGESVPVTTLDSTETAHRFPHFLPDGKHFLYSSLPPHEGKFTIYLASLDGKERKAVTHSAGTGVVYAEPGYLLYQRDDVIVAHAFDAERGETIGEPVSLGDHPMGTGYSGAVPLSITTNGTMAYTTNGPVDTRLAWSDMNGKVTSTVPMEPGEYINVELSPDGRHALLESARMISVSDLWMADLERGVVTRLSYDTGENTGAKWSPDGTRVAYTIAPYGETPKIAVVSVGAGASTEFFLENDPAFKFLHGWTPDGRSIVFSRQDAATRRDIWILAVDGDRKAQPYLATPYWEERGRVSPDGRWMVYDSSESGQFEVYVQSFPEAGAKYQVTTRGGFNRGWSRDGRRLRFSHANDPTATYSADVLPGPQFRLGPPRKIARVPDTAFDFSLASGEDKLLLLMPTGPLRPQTITIVQNWTSLLVKR